MWKHGLLGVLLAYGLRAQVAGQTTAELPDSLYLFESPRPLIAPVQEFPALWGLTVTFSESGFGAGVFYQRGVRRELAYSVELTVGGARNTDEFEVYDPASGSVYVPGKVNRVFVVPLSLSALYFPFTESLEDSFGPMASLGIAPTLIVATPYAEEFFAAFRRAQLFVRLGAHVGVGVRIRYGSGSFLGVGLRYYLIPFGGAGLESVRGSPIRDFGGMVLVLRLPL